MADDHEMMSVPNNASTAEAGPPRLKKRPLIRINQPAGHKMIDPRKMQRPLIKMSHPAHHTPLDPHTLHRPNIKIDQ